MISVLLAIVGLVAGLMGGLLGIGGSIIMIPCMRELVPLGGGRLDQHLYQAAAMIVNFFVVTPSVYQHWRARAVVWPVVRLLTPVACVAVIAGVMLSEMPVFRDGGEAYLAGLFGLFLLFEAGVNFHKLLTHPDHLHGESYERDRSPWYATALVGVAVGVVGGLLGVGGGIVSVPLQQRFLRMPLRNAIANSAATIVVLSLIGASMKNYQLVTGHAYSLRDPVLLAAVLVPTAMIGGLLGGRLTHTLPLRAIRGAFGLLMLVVAIRMISPAAGHLF